MARHIDLPSSVLLRGHGRGVPRNPLHSSTPQVCRPGAAILSRRGRSFHKGYLCDVKAENTESPPAPSQWFASWVSAAPTG